MTFNVGDLVRFAEHELIELHGDGVFTVEHIRFNIRDEKFNLIYVKELDMGGWFPRRFESAKVKVDSKGNLI